MFCQDAGACEPQGASLQQGPATNAGIRQCAARIRLLNNCRGVGKRLKRQVLLPAVNCVYPNATHANKHASAFFSALNIALLCHRLVQLATSGHSVWNATDTSSCNWDKLGQNLVFFPRGPLVRKLELAVPFIKKPGFSR